VTNEVHFEDGVLVYDITGQGDGPLPKINTVTANNAIFGRIEKCDSLPSIGPQNPCSISQLRNGFVDTVLDEFRIEPGDD